MQRWLIEDKDTPTSLHKKGHNKDPLICNYVLNSETHASNGVLTVEHRRRRHRDRQRHGGICNNGKMLNNHENGKKKNGKISDGGRTGKYCPSEPSLLLQKSCTFAVFEKDFAYRHQRMSCMRRGVKTEQLTGRSTHVYFLVAPCSTVVSHFTFRPMRPHWLKA